MKQAFIETVKEVGRIAFFAAIAAVIGYVTTKVSNLDPNSTFYILATLALKLVDKYVHTNEDMSAQGIAPF